MDGTHQSWFRTHKRLVIAVLIVLAVLFIAFGAKIYLYINFILGNDIIVRLSADKETLSVVHGQEAPVTFEASVTTNPFCTASCNSVFTDIGSNTIIEQNAFDLKPGFPFSKSYLLRSEQRGSGQKLYRFSMECQSVSTVLCHTDGEPTSRSILVTLNYYLSEEEKQLKGQLKEALRGFVLRSGEMAAEEAAFRSITGALAAHMLAGDRQTEITSLNASLAKHIEQLRLLQQLWQEQDYALLAEKAADFNQSLALLEEDFAAADARLEADSLAYNTLLDVLEKTRIRLDDLLLIQPGTINTTVVEFNEALELFGRKSTLEKKSQLVDEIFDEADELYLDAQPFLRNETLQRSLETDILYDALCTLAGNCVARPSIAERSNQTEFWLHAACKEADELRDLLSALNMSMQSAYARQSYPATEAFLADMQLTIRRLRQNITVAYLSQLPANSPNEALLRALLVVEPLPEPTAYPDLNLTPALVIDLVRGPPEPCMVKNLSVLQPAAVPFEKINLSEPVYVPLNITFPEPLPQCNVLGSLLACCLDNACRSDPATYPVVFLHGHAFNKDTSADYSLDAFNKIQKRLEQDGYLNAGAISLYSGNGAESAAWDLINAPLTIKASYYFDIFKEPENYIVVQTKSENIETYAIRLKELVDTIRERTGRPKVVLVAHSMGGLVARRYLQLFGSDAVEKLILVAVPNKGIEGDIADYCPVVGEKLECRDMSSSSLFLNKLNRGSLPDIPLVNIVGTGCSMAGGLGDGIVLEKNAMLQGASNYIVNGTCQQVGTLHTRLLDIDAYPEIYALVRQALKVG